MIPTLPFRVEIELWTIAVKSQRFNHNFGNFLQAMQRWQKLAIIILLTEL